MNEIEFARAFDLYKATNAHLNTLWSIFNVVSLATIGFVWGSKAPLPDRGKILLAMGYAVFAVASYRAITRTHALFVHIVGVIHQAPPGQNPEYRAMIESIGAAPLLAVRAFCAAFIIAVLLSIYLVHKREQGKAKTAEAAKEAV